MYFLNQTYCVAYIAKALHSDKYTFTVNISMLNSFQQLFIVQDTESHKLKIWGKEPRKRNLYFSTTTTVREFKYSSSTSLLHSTP